MKWFLDCIYLSHADAILIFGHEVVGKFKDV